MNDNIGKEIFNQFLVDYMENRMLLPENESGYLTIPPSLLSVPGALGIIENTPDVSNTHANTKDKNEKTNFKLTFKLTEKESLKFSFGCSFYLYYKEYPSFEEFSSISDFRGLVNNKITAIQKDISKNLKKDYENYADLQRATNEDFLIKLNVLYNNNGNKNLKIILEKIVEYLSKDVFDKSDVTKVIKDIKEEINELEYLDESFLDSEQELKAFVFNKEDFDTENDYLDVMEVLGKNNNKLYTDLFSSINIDFNYKKIKIDIKPKEFIIEDSASANENSNLNLEINNYIQGECEKQIKDYIECNKVIIPAELTIDFFNYMTKESYQNFIDKNINKKNKDVIIYLPKVIFIKNDKNLTSIVSGVKYGENKLNWFDKNIYNFQMELIFDLQKISDHKYNINQHYKYNYTKKVYCASYGIATQNEIEKNKLIIKTTWNPKYYLPRNDNRYINEDILIYKNWILSENKNLDMLFEITTKYTDWVKNIPNNICKEDGFPNDKENWFNEIKLINDGIKILRFSQENYQKNNKKLSSSYLAWCYLNESFLQIDSKYEKWRLFQMCFLLSLLPSIILRDKNTFNGIIEKGLFTKDELDQLLKKSEQRVNLLYFAAGGGKTEAFLAIIIFSLFFERLSGKACGLTAIIKYPLRLLLTQQTERVLKAVCSAEKIRRKYKLVINENHYDHSFSLAIWVGSSSTPNSIDNVKKSKMVLEIKEGADLSFNNHRGLDWEQGIIEEFIKNSNSNINSDLLIKIENDIAEHSVSIIDSNLSELKKKDVYMSEEDGILSYKKISKCPFCNKDRILLRIYQDSLLHFCANKQCEWNSYFQKFKPLPFYIVDEDVYSRYPSIVISTTDKLARFGYISTSNKGIPDNRHVLGMFGIAPFYDPKSKKILWDEPKKSSLEKIFPFNKKSKIPLISGFPSLIIQDETHLLIESLGSFSAIFERNFNQLLIHVHEILKSNKEIRNFNLPQVIAATATISSPEKQLCPIYDKEEILLFPSLGYKIYENFYSIAKCKQENFVINKESLNEENIYEISRIYNGFFLNDRNYFRATRRFSVLYHQLIFNLVNNGIIKSDFKKVIKNNYYKNVFDKFFHNYNEQEFAKYIKENAILNKILINYSGSKNTNDKLKTLEVSLFEKGLETNSKINSSEIISELNQVSITSDVEQRKLQEILTNIENQSPNFLIDNKNTNAVIKSIFATQSISHGVDSKMFNAMSFHGFPEFINEYIQASARIGRTNVGFVNCFPQSNNKDLLIMNNFEAFHRFIERPVLANKIDFSTKIILQRSLLSMFMSWFVNIWQFERSFNNLNDSHINNLNESISRNDFSFYMLKNDFLEYYSKVICPNEQILFFLKKEVEELLSGNGNSICDFMDLGKINDKYHMMTSLRDTQDTIDIYIGENNGK